LERDIAVRILIIERHSKESTHFSRLDRSTCSPHLPCCDYRKCTK